MATVSSAELRGKLALLGLTPDQAEALMRSSQEHGAITFAAPLDGRAVTIVADDDLQAWWLDA